MNYKIQEGWVYDGFGNTFRSIFLGLFIVPSYMTWGWFPDFEMR